LVGDKIRNLPTKLKIIVEKRKKKEVVFTPNVKKQGLKTKSLVILTVVSTKMTNFAFQKYEER